MDKLRKKAAKAAKGGKRKKCCKSKPRCKGCPVVLHRLTKGGCLELDDAALRKALKKARAY